MAQWVRRGDVLRNMNWYSVTMQKGDSLERIASSVKPAQTVAYIKKWNGFSSSKVNPGTKVKVYPYYVVQWGDTLTDVAKSFGTTVATLAKLNPQIKNVNKIWPNDKIRLPEGREPEAAPPKPATAPKKETPAAKPKYDNPKEEPKRTEPAADYWEDDFPPHRLVAGDYFMRIGDVQFVIPPEFIQVRRMSQTATSTVLRQKDTFKTKDGHSTIMVEMQVWFNNLEEINGYPIPGPIDNQTYYMDGLRPLIAQFKRMPFLPVENEFLNDVMDIHVLAFSNISFTTVPGFPGLIQANLTFYKADMTPIIERPNWTYDQMFIYPLFRWYYQQMLVEKGAIESTTHLMPINDLTFNSDVKFKILNEGALRELKANSKLSTAELEDIGYDVVDMPDDLICTNVFASMGTMLSPLQLDMNETATFQYLGSIESQFQLTFETENADSIAVLERLYQTMERYSRMYRDKIVAGFVGVQNALINMTGIAQSKELFTPCMITDMTVSTSPVNEHTFVVQLSLVSFRHTQYQDERLKGFNVLTREDGEEIATGNVAKADEYTYQKDNKFSLIDEGLAESMLDGLELYPDLELPTYDTLNTVRKKIDAFRKKKGQSPLPIKGDYLPPYNLYREFGKESYYKRRLSGSVRVDPDFYFTYPPLERMRYVDKASMDIAASTVPDIDSIRTVQAQASTGTQVSNMPTANDYNGPGKFRERVRGTDKWNDKILAISNRHGVDPILTKVIMVKESSGNLGAYNPKGPAYGLMQILRRDYNESEYDWNRLLTDADYAIEAGVKMIKGKANYVETLKKKGDGRFADGATPLNILWAYNGVSAEGRGYAEEAMTIYNGLKLAGTSATLTKTAPPAGSSSTENITLVDLMKYAEADVIIPVPADKDEESKLRAENENPNALMKSMLHDMAKYSKRGSMMRCFPSYVLLFVDEGVWVDYRRLWNNYWTYHAVQEISVVKERNNPVDTAYIRLQNIYGALNFKDKAMYRATNKAAKAPEWTQIFTNPSKVGSYWWDVWFPTVSPDMVKFRKQHVERSGMMLRPGARVHIRMGYGSTPSQMPVVFNGRITEMSSGDVVEAVCQSDAIELINPYYGWGDKDNGIKWWHWENDPKEILEGILTDREGIMPFDFMNNLVYKFTERWGKMSKFGIEHFGTVLADDDTIKKWSSLLNGYDAIKNIYATNSGGRAGVEQGDEESVTFWQTNKSPWDIFQFMASVTPGFEAKVHEHGFHSTMFFGEPHWYLKYKYFNVGKGDSIWDYFEALKTSQQYHQVNSLSDIISNGIRTSDRDLCTIAVPIYSLDEKPKASLAVWLDPHIKPEMQRTEMVDTSVMQDYPMLDLAVTWGKNMFGYDTRAQRQAEEAARTHIQTKLREMYQGELLILGDTAIRPGDMLNISDMYTQMFGTVEVGRVVHTMSFDTGFTTSVKPDLLTFHKDSQRADVLPTIVNLGLATGLWGLRKLVSMYALKKPGYVVRALDKVSGFISTIRKIRTAGLAVAGASAAAGPPGWVALVVELLVWVAFEVMITSFTRILVKRRANIGILPLYYKNHPYVAGIDGHRELIPGIVDYNFYPDETPEGGAVIDPSLTTPIAAAIPEGNRMCYPVADYKSRRITTYFGSVDASHKNPHKGIDLAGAKQGVPGDPIFATMSGTVVEVSTNYSSKTGYGAYVMILHEFDDNTMKGIDDPTTANWLESVGTFLGLGPKLAKCYTMSGHLSKVNVRKGQKVAVGDVIGEMGTSGRSTGVHLHYEVRTAKLKGGKLPDYYSCKPIDPIQFFRAGGAYEIKSNDKKGGATPTEM